MEGKEGANKVRADREAPYEGHGAALLFLGHLIVEEGKRFFLGKKYWLQVPERGIYEGGKGPDMVLPDFEAAVRQAREDVINMRF